MELDIVHLAVLDRNEEEEADVHVAAAVDVAQLE